MGDAVIQEIKSELISLRKRLKFQDDILMVMYSFFYNLNLS